VGAEHCFHGDRVLRRAPPIVVEGHDVETAPASQRVDAIGPVRVRTRGPAQDDLCARVGRPGRLEPGHQDVVNILLLRAGKVLGEVRLIPHLPVADRGISGHHRFDEGGPVSRPGRGVGRATRPGGRVDEYRLELDPRPTRGLDDGVRPAEVVDTVLGFDQEPRKLHADHPHAQVAGQGQLGRDGR